MAEAKSAKAASKAYKEGVDAVGGADAYYSCGAKVTTGGVKAVADCMKGLKKKLTSSDWQSKYESAYRGRA